MSVSVPRGAETGSLIESALAETMGQWRVLLGVAKG